MKKNITHYIIIIFSLILVTSCSTFGKSFSGDFSNIKINSTTRSEVEANYGFPFRAGIDNGFKSYIYVYLKVKPFGELQSKEFVIRFNENDTVKDFAYFSSFENDKKIIFETNK